MKKSIIIIKIISFTSVLSLLTGCISQLLPKVDDSGATQEGVEQVVNANNQFAFELYNQLKNEGDNLFISPWSIETALAMTYEGARGKTAEEMQSVLHFPQDEQTRRSAFAKIYNTLNDGSKKYELATANALWVQEDYPFLVKYLDDVKKYYGGDATNLDFIDATEKSRQTINAWVQEKTNDKIKNLIPGGSLDKFTRLVLTNAVYFKGNWLEAFDKKQTKEANFRLNTEQSIKVPMMQHTDTKATFNYAENDSLQILELPYEGEKISMLILLPKENDLEPLEKLLDEKKLQEWINRLTEEKIQIFIPQFKFETKYFLEKKLPVMGMPLAFQWPGADFSGMDGTKNLYITKVIHQAFIDVYEEGTEAAAATAVVGTFGLSGPLQYKIFRGDHPFIFLIWEKATGNILFLGRVVNPAAV